MEKYKYKDKYNDKYNDKYIYKDKDKDKDFSIKDYTNVHCVNCGEKGHIIKDCKGPITSFGLIMFKIVNNKEEEKNDIPIGLKKHIEKIKDNYLADENSSIYPKVKLLLIQRKDTMSFIDFLRGKYQDEKDENYYKLMKIKFEEMTIEERDSLRDYSFDELWDKLWVNHFSKLYINEYSLAKEKFLKIDIKHYLENTTSKWEYSELGLPKGRRSIKERNIDAAEREVCEETGYENNMYHYLKNYPLVTEEFLATNNVIYKHIYYVTKLKEQYVDYIPEMNDELQQGEVKSVGWYSLNETLSLIRDYDTEKKKILEKVYNDIVNMNFKYNLCDNYYFRINIPIVERKNGTDILDLPRYQV